MNRGDFQQLAEEHLRHAKALLDAGLNSGAYYMCGYAVECALKACICSQTSQFDFYPHPRDVQKAWSHNFDDLIGLSGLKPKFDYERAKDSRLDLNWTLVDNWSESSRYERHGKGDADELYAAVSDPTHGVLACIKRYW